MKIMVHIDEKKKTYCMRIQNYAKKFYLKKQTGKYPVQVIHQHFSSIFEDQSIITEGHEVYKNVFYVSFIGMIEDALL